MASDISATRTSEANGRLGKTLVCCWIVSDVVINNLENAETFSAFSASLITGKTDVQKFLAPATSGERLDLYTSYDWDRVNQVNFMHSRKSTTSKSKVIFFPPLLCTGDTTPGAMYKVLGSSLQVRLTRASLAAGRKDGWVTGTSFRHSKSDCT